MRTAIRSLAAASLLVAACSTDTPTDASASTTGTESAATGSNDPGATSGSGATPFDTTSTRTPRATLAPERLETCTPEAALLAGAPDVAVTLEESLGGCGLRAPAQPAAGEAAALDLTVLGGPARAIEATTCASGATPAVDFETHSYATFTSTHRISEDWRVVFAVDDGERVHVGIRLGRNCEAATATTAAETLAFDVAGRGRSLVVHRCEPRSDPPQTPPVCP